MTNIIDNMEALEALYGRPKAPSLFKVANRVTPEYRAWIEASRFCALTTVGPEGTDCSPRGDDGPVVRIMDDQTLALPDRRGNDRIDTLRNIVRDPRCSLMFLVTGSPTVIRLNGRGRITADPELLEGFTIKGRPPRSVILIEIDELYFQCARAVIRAGLWNWQEAPDLPTPGQILAAMTEGAVGGASYDAEWPARAAKTMW
ncbi:pyridoxamine 5'-phosphate oxidase family protein [Aestuariibius sp. 2305UL40-4]|uniref:pyridoxamine 5'-phosphate oxidase family protein n=1 Tax=Aestuariibius violaceus TaxID=3234132 RepID=UPI00345EE8DA